jgi:hypothetical protein
MAEPTPAAEDPKPLSPVKRVDPTLSVDERRPSYEELAVLVVELGEAVEELRAENRELRSRLGELERQLGQHSGNSGKPPSRDSAAERQHSAIDGDLSGQRTRRAAAGQTSRS